MPISKFQNAVHERLAVLLNGYNVEQNVRPDWLVNPKTGYRLELDFWMPEVKIAIEVQGAQHSQFVSAFHQSDKDLQAQQERDDFKRAICQQRGVLLFEVYQAADIDRFLEAAHKHCPEMAFELYKKWASMKALSYFAARLFEGARQNVHVRQPSQVKHYADKIRHICEKYNIPPESIKPDFTIRKVEMSFLGMPIIHMMQDRDGYTKHERVGMQKIEDGVITCIRNQVQIKGGHKFYKFDATTGKQLDVEPGRTGWYIDLTHEKTKAAIATTINGFVFA